MKTKPVKIALDSFGSFLGRSKGCLTVRDKERRVKRYPLFENEIAEIRIRSGNVMSAGALATCAFWGIDVLISTQRGNPVAFLKSLDDDSHVETRIGQYEAMKNGKGIEIAKTIVLSRIEGQNQILRKYGLKQHDIIKAKKAVDRIELDKLAAVRQRLTTQCYVHCSGTRTR